MTVSVLGVAGSPRRGGNSETILDEVLKGAVEAGAVTTKFVLTEKDVQPCRACNACARSHVCVQEDDMAAIIERMKEAKVWVLAIPVYWWGPTAQMKAFIDRWYSVPREVFEGRRVILAVSSGGEKIYADLMVKTFEEIFAYLGMEEYGILYASGLSEKTAAMSDTNLMNDARTVGFNACRL